MDERGRAKGVSYLDRHSRQEKEVFGKAVVLAASCIESARIVLNKSRYWPNESGTPVVRPAVIFATTCMGPRAEVSFHNCLVSRVFQTTFRPAQWHGCPGGKT